MKIELEKKMVEKDPKFFEYLKENKEVITPIKFGFECGDGWYNLINTLMGCIYQHIENKKKEVSEKDCDYSVHIVQIKEKYGGLRFYIYGGDDYVNGMISLAENLSYKVCETCGSMNNVGQTTGWIYTICKDCYNKGIINAKEWKLND